MTRTIAQILSDIVTETRDREHMTVRDCADMLGKRSIAIAILLFSLINSFPGPGIPGLSTITGIPIILLAIQLVINREEIWLPEKVMQHSLHEGKLLRLLRKMVPVLRKTERLLKPRWMALSSPPFTHLAGIMMIIMACILALPIPFANFPCGLTISVLAIGLITRDGLMVLLGILATIISTLLLHSIVIEAIDWIS